MSHGQGGQVKELKKGRVNAAKGKSLQKETTNRGGQKGHISNKGGGGHD